MANFKKLIEHLTCSVCLRLFENPKYLSCYHSFCKGCLEKMQLQSVITCPVCRKETTVPITGVQKLDDNFFVTSLVDDLILQTGVDLKCEKCNENPAITFCADCAMFLCHDCGQQHHQSINKSQNHKIVMLTESGGAKTHENKSQTMKCTDHDEELLFYCETCDRLICMHCTGLDHDGHCWYTLSTIAGKHRDKLKKAIALLEESSGNLSKTLNRAREKIQQEGDEANKKIDEHYNNLILQLEGQKERLKKQVYDSVSEKKKVLTAKVKEMEHAQVVMLNIGQLSSTLYNACDQKLLSAKNQVIGDIQYITSKYKNLAIQQVDTNFVPNIKQLPQFGWLCFMNQITNFTIAVKDHSGLHCHRGDTKVKGKFDAECLQVADTKNGRYSVSFVAQRTGDAKLSIFVNGTEIKESPFSLRVSHSYKTLSKPLKIVNNFGSLGRPWGISFSRDGMWAVTDYSTSFVYIYNRQDELVKMIGSPGTEYDQFECPCGVAFDNSNNLYVVDGGNSRIQKFDLQGKHLLQFGKEKLRNARGITIHNDKVYTADKTNRCVSVFDINGQYCNTIKSPQLRTPCDVTVDINNHLHVTDSDNHCVHTFTLDGNYVRKFGQLAKQPWGLAADLRGNILVTDASNHHVAVFDKDGICIHCFGTKGQSDGEFNTPFGIAFSPKGKIYICDYENKRIQVF